MEEMAAVDTDRLIYKVNIPTRTQYRLNTCVYCVVLQTGGSARTKLSNDPHTLVDILAKHVITARAPRASSTKNRASVKAVLSVVTVKAWMPPLEVPWATVRLGGGDLATSTYRPPRKPRAGMDTAVATLWYFVDRS